jgi:hypothetical protein
VRCRILGGPLLEPASGRPRRRGRRAPGALGPSSGRGPASRCVRASGERSCRTGTHSSPSRQCSETSSGPLRGKEHRRTDRARPPWAGTVPFAAITSADLRGPAGRQAADQASRSVTLAEERLSRISATGIVLFVVLALAGAWPNSLWRHAHAGRGARGAARSASRLESALRRARGRSVRHDTGGRLGRSSPTEQPRGHPHLRGRVNSGLQPARWKGDVATPSRGPRPGASTPSRLGQVHGPLADGVFLDA